MADPNRPGAAAGRRQPSRLQSRAPSSLQINRAVDWNVAIPLLSPLASSPPPPPELRPAAQREKLQPPPSGSPQHRQSLEPENVVFKKWQHPAAPFSYEHSSVVRPFY